MGRDGARAPAGLAELWVEAGVRAPGGRRRLEQTLRDLADYAARKAGRTLAISFALLSDRRMAELHLRHAGVDGPTDVLGFLLAEEPLPRFEVLLSADTARREALGRGHPAYDELVLYAVHGVLHLLGHDDHEPAARRRMRRAERRALAALGLPPVFRGRRGVAQRGRRTLP